MLTETITYTDYDGNVRTEKFYFNLNEAEITEMQFEKQGGLKAWLEKISEAKDNVEIMKMFKKIILRAYGEKSDDGRRLIKSEEISTAFSQTEAYNQLFLKLMAGGDLTMFSFIQNILPEKFRSNVSPEAMAAKVAELTGASTNDQSSGTV